MRLLSIAFRWLNAPLYRRFGEETEATLRYTWVAETAGRGPGVRLVVMLKLLVDIVWNAIPARRSSRSPQRPPHLRGARMDSLLGDLRFALRTLRRNPGFAALVVATLALGIAGTTTVFDIVNAEIIRPLPYQRADRLVSVAQLIDGSPRNFSLANLRDLEGQSRAFDGLTGFDDRKVFNLTGDGDPIRVLGAAADGDFFQVLGVAPLLGTVFGRAHDTPGADLVTVLGEALWRRRYGGDPAVVGTTVVLNDRQYTVLGVMPAAFKIPDREELWVPEATHEFGDGRRGDRAATYLEVIGRLGDEVDLETARRDLQTVAARLAAGYPDSNADLGIAATPLRDELLGATSALLQIALGAVAILLLTACVNVANVMVARAARRQGELDIRVALGASRNRIARQLLTESLVLALGAGTVGAAISFWSRGLLMAAMPGRFPRFELAQPGIALFAFAVFTSLAVGVVFGVGPSWLAARPELHSSLRGTAGIGATRRSRLRNGLVVVQVALALTLLVGAGLLIRSYDRLARVDTGFRSAGVLTAQVALPAVRYDEDGQRRFFATLTERLAQDARVSAAAATTRMPLAGSTSIAEFEIEGRGPDEGGAAHLRQVTPGYFAALDIPLVSGRGFSAADRELGEALAIIDVELAERLWPDESALGARLRAGSDSPWFRVVGIVGATRHWGPRFHLTPTLYVPFAWLPSPSATIAVKAEGAVEGLGERLRQAVWEIDDALPVHDVRTLEQALSSSVAQPRVNMIVFVWFSAVALLLAAVGIYGVVSYLVAQRTHEIGVRIALGARPGNVRWLVVWQGLRLTLLGLAIGTGLAALASRGLESMLFGVTPLDMPTFGVVIVGLLAVSLAAIVVPSRRATAVDPVDALRS